MSFIIFGCCLVVLGAIFISYASYFMNSSKSKEIVGGGGVAMIISGFMIELLFFVFTMLTEF